MGLHKTVLEMRVDLLAPVASQDPVVGCSLLLLPAVLPLGFQLSCEKSVEYKYIEFFVFDYGSLPYLLPMFFLVGSYFFLSLLLIKLYRNFYLFAMLT